MQTVHTYVPIGTAIYLLHQLHLLVDGKICSVAMAVKATFKGFSANLMSFGEIIFKRVQIHLLKFL